MGELSRQSYPTVVCCGDCGGRPRGFREDPAWPACRCPGRFDVRLGGTVYPRLIVARDDLHG
jgi:hypothetical protein